MYKQCKTEQSARRQRELEHALLEMMQSKNYQQITVHELCEFMGIPRKTFYRYFPGKDDALHALIDHTLLEFEEGTAVYAQFGSHATVHDLTSLFEFWLRHRALLDGLERCGRSSLLIQRARKLAEEEHVPCGAGKSAFHQAAWQYGLIYSISGLMAMIIVWHHQGCRENPREMAEIAASVLTQPVVRVQSGQQAAF